MAIQMGPQRTVLEVNEMNTQTDEEQTHFRPKLLSNIINILDNFK